MTNRELLLTNLKFFKHIPKRIGEPQLQDLLKKIPQKWHRWDLSRKLYFGLEIMQDKGCWVEEDWSSYKQIWINSKNLRAHRLSYLIFNNPINPTLFVCHHCDRKGCRNPGHLFLGNQSDNMKDAREKGRSINFKIKEIIPKELRERDQWMKLERFCQ